MSGKESRQGFIGTQVNKRLDNTNAKSPTPPLPAKMSIEINNSCNHKCFFCQNPTMTRQRRVMDDKMVFRLIREGAEAGIREISFYSGGEPFLNRRLPEYVAEARRQGFSYIYLSSNGGKVASSKILPVLDAGLHSLKFSVNAGNRETYKMTHGFDEFDFVIENIKRVDAYRKEHNSDLKLFVTFVETEYNRDSFEELKEVVGPYVDEVVMYPFVVVGTPLLERNDDRPYVGYADTDHREDWNKMRMKLPCYQLWNYLNVTVEGFLSACCSDYNNDLLVGNLHDMSLEEAWHSDEFVAFRQAHIDRNVRGTLCEGCIMQRERPFEPLNQHLNKVPAEASLSPNGL